MRLKLIADGRTEASGTALVMHNERLADPLDTITEGLSEVTGKRKKTREDHMEIGRREFFGGLYSNPVYDWVGDGKGGGNIDTDEVTVGLPSWNVLRCLQEGAKRSKRGPDILRGVSPIRDFAPVRFVHPDGEFTTALVDPEELWKAGNYSLRKSVGVQRNRTMRTRPIFTEWMIELEVEVDPVVLDTHTIAFMWRDAGKYAGLCEMRPVYGRFSGEIEVLEITPEEELAMREAEAATTNGKGSRKPKAKVA